MLSVENSAILDKVWTGFSPATELKPLAVLDFINTLLFIKELDEIQAEKGKNSALSGMPIENPIYTTDQQDLRWSSFHYLDHQNLFESFYHENGVLEFARSRREYNEVKKFDKNDKPLVPSSYLLAETVSRLNQLSVRDDAARTEMINYLAQKAETARKTPRQEPPRAAPELKSVPIELKQPGASRRKKPSARFYKLSFLLLIIGGSIILLYFITRKPENKVLDNRPPVLTEKANQEDTLSTGVTEDYKDDDSETSKIPAEIIAKDSPVNGSNASNKKVNRGTAAKPAPEQLRKADDEKLKPAEKIRNEPAKNTAPTAETKGQYKILEKAYFHDQPDESTRRNAFLVHWNNSYATLQALDEKNGFIYVVFRNHQNQTSKGWLRKKDLRPIE